MMMMMMIIMMIIMMIHSPLSPSTSNIIIISSSTTFPSFFPPFPLPFPLPFPSLSPPNHRVSLVIMTQYYENEGVGVGDWGIGGLGGWGYQGVRGLGRGKVNRGAQEGERKGLWEQKQGQRQTGTGTSDQRTETYAAIEKKQKQTYIQFPKGKKGVKRQMRKLKISRIQVKCRVLNRLMSPGVGIDSACVKGRW